MDLFFSFNGLINRAKWWLAQLIFMVVQMVMWIIVGSVFGLSAMMNIDPNDAAAAEAMMANMMPALIAMSVLVLILLYPALAIATKRWHDRNKSGWWTLIIFIPIAGSIWYLVEQGILRGTDGPNNYGPDPLG